MFSPFLQRLVPLFTTAAVWLADKLLRPLVGGYSVLALWSLLLNIVFSLQNKRGFATEQHLGVALSHEEWQYVQRDLFSFAASGLTLWLIVASFYSKPNQHLLRLCCRLVVTAVFAFVVYNVYKFMKNPYPL